MPTNVTHILRLPYLYVEFVLANVEALLTMPTRTTLLDVQRLIRNKMQLNRPTVVITCLTKKSKGQLSICHRHPKGGATRMFSYCRNQQLIDAV